MYKKALKIILILIVILAAITIIIKIISRPISPNKKINSETKNISPSQIVRFEDIGLENFTCTGLTYDEKSDTFWIADYGVLSSNERTIPRIVQINKDMTSVISELSLNDILGGDINLQGISYDKKDDSLWLATGDEIYNIEKDGTTKKNISLGRYSKYKSNGIAVDNDFIWVLCYSEFLLKMDREGNIIKKIKFNYQNQDHICLLDNGNLYATVGADYDGENNFVFEINTQSGYNKCAYTVQKSFAIEGIIVIDDKMYILNDGKYHKAKMQDSYIAVYDL